MTMVDRYLRAVRDHLPRADQDDIIRELEDSLRSRLEDEAAERGRPLSDTEEAAIIKSLGHPMTVAAHYRGDERTVSFGTRLIGPELFPTYLKVLGVNVVVLAVIAATTALASISLWPGVTGFIVPLAFQFVAVTAIFVWIDRRMLHDRDSWDPRTVNAMFPDVDLSSVDGIADQIIGKAHRRTVAMTTSALELGLLAVALTAWRVIGLPEQMEFLKPGPGWADLYWPATVVIVASLLTPVVTLIRPRWTRFRVAAHALVDVATVAIGGVSLVIGSWVVLVDPAGATVDQVRVADLVNTIVRVSIALTIVLTAISAAFELRRLRQLSEAPPD